MRIKSLKIKNSFLGWEFEEIKFYSNLTLLVGISGVGKTQILQAIDDLKDIANGNSINGFEWDITFSTVFGKEYTWKGAFSVTEDNDNLLGKSYNIINDEENDEKSKPTITFESLQEVENNTEFIIYRDIESIKFNGKDMPKLSSFQSLIFTLKEEDSIKEVFNAFKKIILKDHTRREGSGYFSKTSIGVLREKYKTLEEIKNSNENVRTKLFLCSELKLPIFDDIKSRFFEIFPQIIDLKIEQLEDDDFPFRIDQTIPIISIKENNVEKWIRQDRMSSGMLRTILHICEIFLSNDGSVILIDEVENSLGINCIDILTDDLIHENKTLQFIATSHHPYIINNIPYEYWKIVSRKGGKIEVKDASSYNLGKSKQDAFIQLTKILDNQY